MKEAIEIQLGEVLDFTLSSAVNVGDVIPLGSSMVCVANMTGLPNEQITVTTERVWTINATTADAFDMGDEVFFNVTSREITKTSSGNTRAGRAVSIKTAGTAGTVNVKLNQA